MHQARARRASIGGWMATSLAAVVLAVLTATATAQPVRVVTWNVESCKSIAEVEARGDDFAHAFAALRPDVLLLQELNSKPIVEKILSQAGQDPSEWHVVCTEFSPGEGTGWGDLEVAVASRWPVADALEYDEDLDQNAGGLAEVQLRPPAHLNLARVASGRGFLRARIADAGLIVYVTHLKSSRGDSGAADVTNAQKRELVAASMADAVLADLRYFPNDTVVLGGDLNVGCADKTKNGRDLADDCISGDCEGKDRYDETHALLSEGLVGGLRMRNLFSYAQRYEQTTYPSFPGTPIDNLYVAGARENWFRGAEIVIQSDSSAGKTFGSDHRPVLAIFDRP